jgi:nanoRNase/pAp phosphatase (c-di-AMP/oligoRNAs hydrolase)
MIIATTHKNTDFDALASVIGATILYPGCMGVIPKAVNRNVAQFLSTHKTAFDLLLPNEVEHTKVNRLIVVDTNQWHRLDRMDKLRGRDGLQIDLWDHHMTGESDIRATWTCRESIGATVTLLIREMIKRKIRLNPLVSTVLLIGLYEDTGHLSFPSTTPEDARAAAFLLENDADLNVAGFFLNPPYEETQREVLFEMMQNTEKITVNGNSLGFNIITLDKKVTDLATVVNMYRKIINTDGVFVIFVNSSRSMVIGRSNSDQIHIGRVMTELGGGGHGGAGSASIKKSVMSPENIKESIISILSREKRNTIHIGDIMSFPVISVTPETSMREVRELMDRKKIRGVMVVNGKERIEGIIVLWDFKKIKKERQWNSPVKAFMVRDVTILSPETSPAKAAQTMIEKDVGHLPVVRDGKMIGIVTRTDILTYFYDLLPD